MSGDKLPRLAVPRYECAIPSTGEKASYRPFTVGEEKVLLMAAESGDERTVLNAIVDIVSAATDGRFSQAAHTQADLDYMFIMIRAVSVGETAQAGMKCGEDGCDGTAQVEIDLSQVKVDKAEESATVELAEDVKAVMRDAPLRRVLDSLPDGRLEGADRTIANVALRIAEIHYGEQVFHAGELEFAELVEFVEQLPPQKFALIQEQFMSHLPYAYAEVEWQCPQCEAQNSRRISGTQVFFG